MFYRILIIGERQIKIRYTTNSICELERVSGGSLDQLFNKGEYNGMRTLIWAGAIQLQNGRDAISLLSVGNMLDKHNENGGTNKELIDVLDLALQDAGFIAKDEKNEDENENENLRELTAEKKQT